MGLFILSAISRSIVAKIFAICFVAIHLPLIAAMVSMGGFERSLLNPLFGVLLAATLVGAGFCLWLCYRLLRPISQLSAALDGYKPGEPIKLAVTGRSDEVGRLQQAAVELTGELDTLFARLRREATEDPLTGLCNRRAMMERAAGVLDRGTSAKGQVSLIVFDLDRFKAINDNHGHGVGDSVLIEVGQLLSRSVRPTDIAARMGGEEFAVLLPQTGPAEALAIAERLRDMLRESEIGPLGKGAVTASFGVVTSAALVPDLRQLLNLADRSLYLAKQRGRDRIESDLNEFA